MTFMAAATLVGIVLALLWPLGIALLIPLEKARCVIDGSTRSREETKRRREENARRIEEGNLPARMTESELWLFERGYIDGNREYGPCTVERRKLL